MTVYIDIYTLQLCIIDLTQQGCHTLRLPDTRSTYTRHQVNMTPQKFVMIPDNSGSIYCMSTSPFFFFLTIPVPQTLHYQTSSPKHSLTTKISFCAI